MLSIIENLPDHVIGIRITDKLRAEDYERLLIPLVNNKLERHSKLDLLCCIEGEWKGMEAGAAWQDLRLGLGKLGHWARMAIVSDIDWLEKAIKVLRLFSPGELRHFDDNDYDDALAWVCQQDRARIRTTLDSGAGILVVEPDADAALSEDDFEAVGKAIRKRLEDHDRLRGILIRSRRFPGWQGVSAMFAHLKFINRVHDKIDRIALVTSSPLGSFADHVLDPLMLAEIRRFDYDRYDEAMDWLKR